jgi:hypothetical protein
MAIKDYNGSSFRNAAIDRLSGKFGKGDEPTIKKKTTISVKTPTVTVKKENPLNKPLVNTSVSKTPSKPLPASSTSSSSSSTPAAKPAAPKTVKEVKRDVKVQKIQAKADKKLDKIKNPKTAEEKEARNKKIAGAVSSAAGAVVSGLELVDRTRQTFPGKKSN